MGFSAGGDPIIGREAAPRAGARGALRGLWHVHVGWLWRTNGQARAYKYARELVEDRGMKRINRAFTQLILLSLGLPFLLGLAITGTLRGGLTGLLWGGFARIFIQHHVTWSVNSICHFFGTRRFAVEDESTNVFWLALPSFSESWHHNHHAFPRLSTPFHAFPRLSTPFHARPRTACAGGSWTCRR